MAQKGTISGSINDANNGDPLLGANVIIKETSQGASTDTDGHFTISRVNPGNYTLIVTYIGYQTLKNKLDLGDGETINVELTLNLKPFRWKLTSLRHQGDENVLRMLRQQFRLFPKKRSDEKAIQILAVI